MTIIDCTMSEAEINAACDAAIRATMRGTVAARTTRPTVTPSVMSTEDDCDGVWSTEALSDFERGALLAMAHEDNERDTARARAVLASIPVDLH